MIRVKAGCAIFNTPPPTSSAVTHHSFEKRDTSPIAVAANNRRVINDIEEKITQAGLDGSSAKIFPAGTLLMAMYGQGITRGKVGILGVNAATNQARAAFFPKDEVRTGFLYQLFAFKYDYIRNLEQGANQKNLSVNILETVQISFPTDTYEPDEITTSLSALDDKFMTAQIRVHDLDLD